MPLVISLLDTLLNIAVSRRDIATGWACWQARCLSYLWGSTVWLFVVRSRLTGRLGRALRPWLCILALAPPAPATVSLWAVSTVTYLILNPSLSPPRLYLISPYAFVCLISILEQRNLSTVPHRKAVSVMRVQDAYGVVTAVRECLHRDSCRCGVGAVVPGGSRHPVGRVSTWERPRCLRAFVCH